jgi:uncharacterized cofD-like protein
LSHRRVDSPDSVGEPRPSSPQASASSPRIVSIGGGTGLGTLLRGLKKEAVEISVLVAVTDDGGSSGRLREELGVLPPGDIRNCMVALSEDEALMSRLFRHRFSSLEGNGPLHDHSFGNLFLTAMADVTGDFAEAVRLTSEVLAIKGTIYPATTSDVTLRAHFDDGRPVEGETRITADRRRIRRVELSPSDAHSVPEALEALATADLITIGPGSLYTSLIANLLPPEIVPALRASPARKVYIQNIMTQPAETAGLTMADHVQAVIDHCGELLFPTAIVNTRMPSDDVLRKYEEEGAEPVRIDRDRIGDLGVTLIELDLISEGDVIRHDPDRLAEAVVGLCGI